MLQKALNNAHTVAISGHVRPDGDCVGSTMGLYQYIKTWYPHILGDVYLEEIPDSFHFIDAAKEIRHSIKDMEYDLFICLDCGDLSRLGFSGKLFQSAKHTLCVDHHISNSSFAEENYIKPEASSTSELIYELIDPEKVTKEVAQCLYLGIVHDTGVFQHSCTSPKTMNVAAKLMQTGINCSDIIQKTYYEKTYVQNQILGRALLDSVLFMDGKCIVSVIDRTMMDLYHANGKDLEGIVNQLRITKGVKIAIFMYETDMGVYKVSLRSDDDIDSSKISTHFGGGGHKKAAGFSVQGEVKEIIELIADEIKKQL